MSLAAMIKTTQKDLHDLWSSLQIQNGDVLMVHSFLPSLGQIQSGPNAVISTLLDRVGQEGNIIAPTFTYSHFNDEIFDITTSSSKVGMLGDLMREREDSVRSSDPNFSMVSIGKNANELMYRETIFSFGLGSIYQKLMDNNLHILLLGTDYTALSLFMHLEKTAGVNYRYDKKFKGKSQRGGRVVDDESIHFVRSIEASIHSDRNKIGSFIDSEAEVVKSSFGYGEHRYFKASTAAKIIAKRLSSDPGCLVEGDVTRPVRQFKESN